MSNIEQQIIDTWRVHQQSMVFMLKNIKDEAFGASLSTRGGRDVARQLAHVHNVRVSHVQSFAKKAGLPLAAFDKNDSPSKARLLEAFAQSGTAVEKYLEQSIASGSGVVSNFKKGVVPLLGYLISHEAHHRGHAFLTMKKCGFPLPDELRWGVWDWNKMHDAAWHES
jgi:uncharacterized damage-inducible protein DinB